MARRITFGRQPETAPPGTFRPIVFPMLGHLDKGTKEGMISRKLSSDGANARDLPRTGYFQYQQDMAHFGSIAAFALHEITVDGETGEFSGKGWLADNEAGHAAEIAVLSKSLYNNSIDLGDIGPADIEIIEHGDFWDDDFWAEIIFKNWSVLATTLVGKEAFAGSHAVIPDEIRASLGSPEPLVVECDSVFSAHTPVEIVASAATLPSWDYFHRPEADIPHPIIVGTPDEHGWIPVYGHLAQWGQPHRGMSGTVYPPRPRKDYREFNRPGVLTDRGQVETGPIVLYGGHISLKDACDDPRNAWADVKVHAGRHGPWVCGVVRPHIAQDAAETYVARASQLSGHWLNDDLCMIISCNYEGFQQDGLGAGALQPGELVASFVTTDPAAAAVPRGLLSFTELSQEDHAAAIEWLKARRSVGETLAIQGPAEVLDQIRHNVANLNEEIDQAEKFNAELEQWRLAEELALEAEAP